MGIFNTDFFELQEHHAPVAKNYSGNPTVGPGGAKGRVTGITVKTRSSSNLEDRTIDLLSYHARGWSSTREQHEQHAKDISVHMGSFLAKGHSIVAGGDFNEFIIDFLEPAVIAVKNASG